MDKVEHKITTVTFVGRLDTRELTGFRGAIASLFPEDTMYHNHEGDVFVYRYPLIQYKFIDGRISLVGIDGGADSLEKKLQCGQQIKLSIHGREKGYRVAEKKTHYYIPESSDEQSNYYFLRGWLALNQENFARYLEMESISEKIALLDSILSANILSLFCGFGYYSNVKSRASILEIVSSRTVKYKGNEMISFDIRFKCNSILPELCGLGKGVSRGFGVIHASHPCRK